MLQIAVFILASWTLFSLQAEECWASNCGILMGAPVQVVDATEVENQHEVNKKQNIKVPPLEKSLLLTGRAPRAQLPRHHVLKVFIWNVKKMKSPKVHKFLHKYSNRADVALLQEGGYGLEADKFWKNIDLNTGLWSFAVSYEQGNLVTGVLTRTVFQPLKQKILRSRGHEVWKKSRKNTLLSYLPIEGQVEPLLVVNVHGLNFVSLDTYTAQMKHLAEHIAQHKGPAIVGGDFNSYTLRRSRRLEQSLQALGLEEVKMQGRRRFWPWKLDRLFARGFQVLNTRMMYESEGSDHEALWAELRLTDK